MSVTLSVVIMADKRREAAAEALSAELDAPIVWDRGQGIWDTARRAWRAYSAEATHHIVVQDDALPIPDFRRHAAAAIAARPDALVNFYLGRGAPMWAMPDILEATREADRTGSAWIELPFAYGVALAAPTAMLPDLLREATAVETGIDTDDGRLSVASQRLDMEILATWPSLVDHADTPSLHAITYLTRVAIRTGVSATWNTPATPL